MKNINICKIFMIALLCMPTIIKAENELAPSASSVMVLEHTTGEIIYERNAHEKLPPASMTKIMTMLIVMEAIEKEIVDWNDIVVVSENSSSMGGSQILLETGEKMTVEDLFKGLAIASGNDAAVALAEKISGTEEAFVEQMNQKARDLGLENTNFENSHGLDDANHYSSAYDMAKIAQELLKYEEVLNFTSIYEDYLRQGTDRAFWLVNTNKLVRFYDSIDGLKTGYTTEAQFCLTATGKKDNMRIISVVMGEPDSNTRDSETSSIFDYVFAQYALKNIINKEIVIDTVAVEKGKQEKVEIVATSDVNDLYLKVEEASKIEYNIIVDELVAPIKHGDIIGKIEVVENGQLINKVDLTVKETVEQSNLFELYFRYLKQVIR